MDRRKNRGKYLQRKKHRIKVWPKALLTILVIGLLGTVGYMLLREAFSSRLQLKLTGEQEITLEYGESYEEQGASAWFSDPVAGQIPVEVTQTGSVNDQKLGTYEITYTAVYKTHTGTVLRRVHIVDTKAPEIILTGSTDVTVPPSEAYQEEGFAAADNYDGDLTGLVRREDKDGVITYTVTDSSGNETSVTRNITIHDPIPPVVELSGGSVTLGLGGSYQEPGYTASDNYDGDMTAAVAVTGQVDTGTAGIYTLTYTVTDSFQNTASVTREVCVLPMPPDQIGEKTGKVIYLTFDDGPSKYTNELLDVLAKYNVKVTFFVVETSHMSVIKRAADEGHTVAIHTASHRFEQVYASEDAYFADLYKMQDIIEQYTGKKSMLLRFPGGSSNTISRDYSKGIMTRLTAAVQEQGFSYFDWNVDSNDAGGTKTAEGVFENVVEGIGDMKKSVVLQHDSKSYSVEAVEQIILWGLKNGYTFLPLTQDSPSCHHTVNN